MRTAVLYEAVRDEKRPWQIPKGTEFFGRVTQVQPAKRPQREATTIDVFETTGCLMESRRSRRWSRRSTITPTTKRCGRRIPRGRWAPGKSGSADGEERGDWRRTRLAGWVWIIGAAGGGLGGMAGAAGAGVLGGVLMTKGNDIRLQPGNDPADPL
jgi:hypothetical protein